MTLKRKVILVLGIAALIGVIAFMTARVFAQSESRFSKIDIEDFKYSDGVAVNKIEVIHDKQTGNEIVCMENVPDGIPKSLYTLSCFQTGRNWK